MAATTFQRTIAGQTFRVHAPAFTGRCNHDAACAEAPAVLVITRATNYKNRGFSDLMCRQHGAEYALRLVTGEDPRVLAVEAIKTI